MIHKTIQSSQKNSHTTLPREPFIIAEIGINHNGDLAIAKKLIDMAKQTGCDAVKFQKRTIETVYSREVLDTPRESPWGTTQRAQKEGLEFGKKEYDEIDRYCKEVGIDWFASAWDLGSQEFLQKYNLKYNKIASAMTTYPPLLEMVAKEGKPTFISTGMCDKKDIDQAVAIFRKHNCRFILMHSVSVYPAADDLLNLRAIQTLQETYQVPVGYSGHEVGVVSTVIAVALGAVAVERHITLDRAMYGSDQAASVEKPGLERIVRDCRLVQPMMGTGELFVLEKEIPIAKKLRWFNEGK